MITDCDDCHQKPPNCAFWVSHRKNSLHLLSWSLGFDTQTSYGQCKVCFAQIANILNLIFEQDEKKKLNFT